MLAHRAVLEMLDGAYQSALASADGALADRPRRRRADAAAARASTWSAAGAAAPGAPARRGRGGARARSHATPRERDGPAAAHLRTAAAGLRADRASARSRRPAGSSTAAATCPSGCRSYLARLDRLVRLLIAVAMGDLAGRRRPGARDARGSAPTPRPRSARPSELGLGGDEPRAVRLLDELLPATVDAPVTVGLGAAVARVAFLAPDRYAGRGPGGRATWCPTCSAGPRRSGCCGCSPSAP